MLSPPFSSSFPTFLLASLQRSLLLAHYIRKMKPLVVTVVLVALMQVSQTFPTWYQKGWLRLLREGESCGACNLELCSVPTNCRAGTVLDLCGCCSECGNVEGQICDLDKGSNFYGHCGDNLECRLDIDAIKFGEIPEPQCVCKSQVNVCGPEGKTYENICQFNEFAAEKGTNISIKHKGPCRSAPVISLPPQDTQNFTGNDIIFGCEVSAYPMPHLEWKKKGNKMFLPGDDSHISIQAHHHYRVSLAAGPQGTAQIMATILTSLRRRKRRRQNTNPETMENETSADCARGCSLAELEVLCKQLYEGTDLAQRIQAEKVLLELINSPECLSQCQLLLEQGTTSYAQLLAATCLSKLVCKTTPLPIQQRMDIRNYILNYVASRPKLTPFVIQALVQVIAKITKLGWFDVQKDQLIFRDIIADVKKFLQGTVDHCIIGVTILSELTLEMNFVDYSRPSSKHRKIATSFRDTTLKDILMLACSLLKEMLAKPLDLQDQQQQNLALHLLKLVLNCLNYDFIGSSADESADDLCTVQIPTNWRSIFLEPETLDLFFDLYHSLPSMLSQLALSCLVQFASTRRSLFSNPERAKYLGNLIKGVKRILENPQGLSDPGNYHEFCRFLARLKTNYQLGELVVVKDYPEVIRLIASFTITSLQHWEFAPNSVHYLLTLWQRMVASVPFVKSSEPHLLDTYAPEITKAYITSRLESVSMVMRDGLDDPLDDTATVFQQLEQLCTVSRCEYEKTCTLLVQLFDQNAQNYQKLLQSSSRNPLATSIQEGRLAWLVYFVGTVVGGRLTYTSTEEHDAMDGELSCRVFQLISLMDAQLPRCSNEKVELAVLWFLDQFRKTYVGDQLQRTSKTAHLSVKTCSKPVHLGFAIHI
ncbi:ran-binding protein 17-like isoform X2 [Varanus komodoensis]|uniref:ran-binding protein 17-like isoform X2 n=1 Tax=Varanus komodoensis TaxID=61221 RepID=UPI001CF79506|nr:ran-binding protein 17-like isoform X2 [Varanus komodoensis]